MNATNSLKVISVVRLFDEEIDASEELITKIDNQRANVTEKVSSKDFFNTFSLLQMRVCLVRSTRMVGGYDNFCTTQVDNRFVAIFCKLINSFIYL